MNSLGSRIAGTILALTCWLAFTVLFLAFYAGTFDFWQKLAVFIASGAIVLGVVAVLWVRWAIK